MIEIEGILTKDILKEVYYEGGIFPNLKKRNYFCLFLIVIMLCLTPMLKEYKTFGYILLFFGGMSVIFINLLACYAKKKVSLYRGIDINCYIKKIKFLIK